MKIVKFILDLSFVITSQDLCILFYKDLINIIIIIVGIDIDDIIIILNCNQAKDKIKIQPNQKYQIKDFKTVKKIIG